MGFISVLKGYCVVNAIVILLLMKYSTNARSAHQCFGASWITFTGYILTIRIPSLAVLHYVYLKPLTTSDSCQHACNDDVIDMVTHLLATD
jgi:hypothetical protein